MTLWSVILAAGCLTPLVQPPKKPFVSPMFSENMVLQRDREDRIWGWTAPGASVSVTLGNQKVSTVAGKDGKWMAKIGPFPAGGPYTVLVNGLESKSFGNVLFGDVWICSGQSNMEMGIAQALNSQTEIASANFPNIRLYAMPRLISLDPNVTNGADWKICSPDSVLNDGSWGGFSAVAYFFGRKLNQDLSVPIGLIHTSWGGTPAEAWTEEDMLGKRLPEYKPVLAQIDAARKASVTDPYTPWFARNDAGSKASPAWSDPSIDTSDWTDLQIPGYFTAIPSFAQPQSVVWERREIDIPEDVASKAVTLHFVADDNDTTWVNGIQVGKTDGYNIPRAYALPSGLLKTGKNVIVVRVTDTTSPGGIYGDPSTVFLEVAGGTPISLAGTWKIKAGAVMTAADPYPMSFADNPNLPTVLYNGMIEPIVPLSVKGAIWYQGESNAGRAYQYRRLLPAMIDSWRTKFAQKIPFLVVQLAGFGAPTATPGDDAWAELREAQWLTAQHTPHVGIATAIDVGDSVDIHPKNKQEVGRRLALVAERQVYGLEVESSGPVYKSMSVVGSTIWLKFDHAAGLAKKGNGPLQYFAIAGADHKWFWADAKIDGQKVIVSSPQVPKPVAVRYSWGSYLESNLVNIEGLPAFPFRTDDWKGVTQN